MPHPDITFCVMFTPSSNFACEFQGLAFSLLVTSHCNFLLLLILVALCLYGTTSKIVHISFSPRLSTMPVIKELSPHSKLFLFVLEAVQLPTFLLCSLLPGKSCHEEALEGYYEQGWSRKGTCSSCFLPAYFLFPLLNFWFLSLSLRGCLLTPAGCSLHIEVFPPLAGPILLCITLSSKV